MSLIIQKTALSGVLVITPPRFKDDRGFFVETWNHRTMEAAGLDYGFVQDNHSLSREVGTVRGLHFQAPPHAQAKLVHCGRGCLFDVAVDIRHGSPTFGQWVGEELSFENGKQLLIPAGFLHGFVTRQPDTEIIYKCSDYYSPECDGAVRFDDPDIGIDWGLNEVEAVLSDKDSAAPFLKDFDIFKSSDRQCLQAWCRNIWLSFFFAVKAFTTCVWRRCDLCIFIVRRFDRCLMSWWHGRCSGIIWWRGLLSLPILRSRICT